MKVLCVFGEHNYGLRARGIGYEYANFIPALTALGHEVAFFESYDRSAYPDFVELNKCLLETIERESPDAILSVQSLYEVWTDTWRIIRESGTAATVNWATDDSWKYGEFSRYLAPVFDAFVTTYEDVMKRYHLDGHTNVMPSQWAASGRCLKEPLRAEECEHAVSFVGTADHSRVRWIEALKANGISVNCFGFGWPSGPVEASRIPEIHRRSRISLNFAGSREALPQGLFRRGKQIKARTFEVPGAGGFLLTEYVPGIEDWYGPGREVACFRTTQELEAQCRYYLRAPRERDHVAAAGYDRTRREHTYEHRLAKVLAFALQQRASRRITSKDGARLDWQAFQEAVRRHRRGPGVRGFATCLATVASAIWGPRRGPRAARRAVFEVSWRLAGDHTYSAGGLPGRMFYESS
jgi:spore maturation protein CgeB